MDELFTREEVLGGLPARRAQALFFLIEYWSVRINQRNREMRAIAMSMPAEMANCAPLLMNDGLIADIEKDPDEGFYKAFGLEKEGLPPANLRQIEATASSWVHLVPDNPRLKAAVARLMGRKYALESGRIPNIRKALALDSAPVQKAYQSMYREELATLYKPSQGFFQKIAKIFRRN